MRLPRRVQPTQPAARRRVPGHQVAGGVQGRCVIRATGHLRLPRRPRMDIESGEPLPGRARRYQGEADPPLLSLQRHDTFVVSARCLGVTNGSSSTDGTSAMAYSVAVAPAGEPRTWTVLDGSYATVLPVEDWLDA